ncbi:UMP-CMP kinase 2, mitochondrial [Perognathus longimembris pacificus]|uniref:UMP-CMP kinase 2, mitochondrial n=1 Tax=Perognathus longimembris pacificus TaxID=214514 RepID=UPI002019A4EB|nr:UMP-CMP kinase 2, mitochondrial [Perognathus longimembris pacificus]
MAPPPRYALELPGGALLHFAVGGAGGAGEAGAPAARPDPRLAAWLGPPGRSYSLCAPAGAGGERVRAARRLQRLRGQLQRAPFRGCQLRPLLGYGPGPGPGGGGLQPGFLLRDPRGGADTRRALRDLVGACPEPGRPHLGEFEADARGALWQRLWAPPGGGPARGARSPVLPVPEPPPLHPAVPDLHRSVVFRDRDAASAVLRECTSFIPEAQAVLDLVDQCPRQVRKGKFQVIAIEGLDATGKTTVTQSVSASLNAVLLQSPPPCIRQWRQIFDEEPPIIRRAFYSLGNYLVASEIAKESIVGPVIVDRYWHSTAAYAIAAELSGGPQHLPPARHPVYQWPGDLLKPDLVLLLTVSPEERVQRLRGRGLEQTREEAELEANSIFRQKVQQAYQRMENPSCLAVDASPSREEVLQTVLQRIRTPAD